MRERLQANDSWGVNKPLALGLFCSSALLFSGCLGDWTEPATYACSAEHPGCPAGYTCNGTMCMPSGTDGPVVDLPRVDWGVDMGLPDGPDMDGPKVDGPAADAGPDGPMPDGKPDAEKPDGPGPDLPQTDGPKPDTGPVCPKGTKCDDKDPCTANDVCDGKGGCAGTPSLWDTLLWDTCTWG